MLQDDSSNYFTAKNMEGDLDLDRIGMEMIELLGGLKHQTIYQLDWNLFQDDNDTQEKSKKGLKSIAAETRTRKNYSTRSKPEIF